MAGAQEGSDQYRVQTEGNYPLAHYTKDKQPVLLNKSHCKLPSEIYYLRANFLNIFVIITPIDCINQVT